MTRRLLAVLATAAGGLALATATANGAGSGACGSASTAVAARVDSQVMAAVQRVELGGAEVQADLAHVTGAGDLLRAVARRDPVATRAAVLRIVFHRHWHIVRLRVSDASGRVLSDVGGAHVISPVPGNLTLGGRPVGTFLMSVQDDVGFIKLERLFIGDDAGLYGNGRLIVGVPSTLPRRLPARGHRTIGGVRALISSQVLKAFPNGALRLSLLVPQRPPSVAALPCALVRLDELGHVAREFSHRFRPLSGNYGPYATTVNIYTGTLVLVRDGATQLASSGGAGPLELPASGSVLYEGHTWYVYSFAPAPPARIYVLVDGGVVSA